MKLYTIDTGLFKLDGGAMFGVVPKSIWNKLNPADENNMCTWAMRCLLVEMSDRLILIDNGIGNKQDAKFFSYYHLHGKETLEKSLKKYGFSPDDITDMFLTHLHFDHCGGSIKYNKDRTKLEPVFKNAVYWSNKDHWIWATEPNRREKASFLQENILPIEKSGQLKFVNMPGFYAILAETELFPDFNVIFSKGHTDGMMHPMIRHKGKTIVYVSDMIPSSAHIPVPYVMGYDTRPMYTMEEKEVFLEKAVREDYILYFEHDPVVECCTLQQMGKGIRIKETFTLKEYFG